MDETVVDRVGAVPAGARMTLTEAAEAYSVASANLDKAIKAREEARAAVRDWDRIVSDAEGNIRWAHEALGRAAGGRYWDNNVGSFVLDGRKP